MNCFYCGQSNYVKAGFAKGKQRYKCKECKSHFTVEEKSTAKPKSIKRLALQMYLEGLGFNSIGRILNVSHVAVYKWIRKYGKQAEELRSDKEIEVVEIDEMHSYIGSKKTIFGSGLLLTDMENGLLISFWGKETALLVKSFGKK